MDIENFRTFLAAAATGSFAGAAQRVNASPSSVTERIKQLEHRLSARLFDRSKRGCSLTPAGQKFVGPARQAVRAWEIARYDVSLPEHFNQSLAFGGQYALWEGGLINWLADVRHTMPHTAFRVTAGAPARLNRDLADGFLDFVVMYDPVFRRDVGSEKLFDDRLILVTGNTDGDWHDDYVQIDWGDLISHEIASRLDISPVAGLALDLGARSSRWLIDQKMAGFMPERLVQDDIANGLLKVVEGIPSFDYPAFACWRREIDRQTVSGLVLSLKLAFQS